MRILIIDDDPDSSGILKDILELEGYDVDVAGSAGAGLRLCPEDEDKYGVLFLDLDLPDRNGLDMLPDLRDRCPLGEIFILTGNKDVATAAEAVNSGASGYV